MIGMPRPKDPRIPDAVLDQLLAGANPKTVFDPNGLLDDLKKAGRNEFSTPRWTIISPAKKPGNRRNDHERRRSSPIPARSSWRFRDDRQAQFDPQLIAKYQRRFPGFDDKIISMYAGSMSTREIVGPFRDLYGIEISPDLISAVTDAVLEEVASWHARPLEAVYPLIFFDALRLKVRVEGLVRNKAVHIALGVRGGRLRPLCAGQFVAEPAHRAVKLMQIQLPIPSMTNPCRHFSAARSEPESNRRCITVRTPRVRDRTGTRARQPVADYPPAAGPCHSRSTASAGPSWRVATLVASPH